MRERRRDERLQNRNRTEITVLSAPEAHDLEQRSFSCFTEDVSEGGLRLHVPHAVPVGSKLELLVKSASPRKRAWHVGRVVWARKEEKLDSHCVGVRFLSSPEQALKAWQEILREKFAYAVAKTAR